MGGLSRSRTSAVRHGEDYYRRIERYQDRMGLIRTAVQQRDRAISGALAFDEERKFVDILNYNRTSEVG